MTNPIPGIFTPLADDNLAAPSSLWEVATVKDSGYLHGRGRYAADNVPEVAAALTAYLTEQGRQNTNVYVRTVGSTTWADVTMTSPFNVTVPDALPDDFKA